MGIDNNFVGGYLSDQKSLDDDSVRRLKTAFFHDVGRALSDPLIEFLDACEVSQNGDTEVFFYPLVQGSDKEVARSPYGGPLVRLPLDEFLEVTNGTEDARIVALRESVKALRDGPQTRFWGEFALYWYPT